LTGPRQAAICAWNSRFASVLEIAATAASEEMLSVAPK